MSKPTEAQATALKQDMIEARENEALEALEEMGFRVTMHTLGRYVEADELLGIPAGYKPGDCYAVMYARDGRRKHVAGGSAVEALQQAASWWKWQQGLNDSAPNRFIPAVDHAPTAVPIVQRPGSEQVAKQRHDGNEKRILSFENGTPGVVDAHGAPVGEENHASQYTERTTS